MDIPANTLIAQYGGFRFANGENMADEYIDHAKPGGYRHSLMFCDLGRVDIPHGFEPIDKYNATYGHKINHSFGNDVVRYSYVRYNNIQEFSFKYDFNFRLILQETV